MSFIYKKPSAANTSCSTTCLNAPGPLSRRVWCKGREQKVVFPASAEEWSSTVLNWCSDQRVLWTEEPAAPSNIVILGMPGCCSCLSWLMTSPFDPSHESWQAPQQRRLKHKYKVQAHTQKHEGAPNISYVGIHICSCSLVWWVALCSCIWIKIEYTRLSHTHFFSFTILPWPLTLNINGCRCTCCLPFVETCNKHRPVYSPRRLILLMLCAVSVQHSLITGSSDKSDSCSPMSLLEVWAPESTRQCANPKVRNNQRSHDGTSRQ